MWRGFGREEALELGGRCEAKDLAFGAVGRREEGFGRGRLVRGGLGREVVFGRTATD